MKRSIFSFLVLVVLLTFVSCDKSDLKEKDEIVTKDELWDKDWVTDHEVDKCFQFVFPISFTMPDGSTLSGGPEELKAAIKSWYEDHPDVAEKPALEYPVQITFEDIDQVVTVNNEAEWKAIKEDCYDHEVDKCFQFVYPISFTMPDGSTLSGGPEELKTAIKSWYENHPDVAEKPALHYPVQVTFEDVDQVVTVNNEGELKAIKEDCYDKKDDCFEFVYPISYTMPDGSTLGGGPEELEAAIKTWYEDHPDVAEKPALVYPVQITFEDVDQIVTVNNETEMEAIKEDCYGEEDCFELVYPVSYTMPDGSTLSGGPEELKAAINSWYEDHPDVAEKPALVYPVQITFEDVDQIVTVNNEAEMEAIKEDCED